MKKSNLTMLLGGTGLLVLILDTKTAISGMRAGMDVCFETLIPSLFPFILASTLLTASLLGRKIPLLGQLCRFMGMPAGTESLFVAGLLGGYPVGAQCVANAAKGGYISREKASRMLAYCSNAGPAFLFGIGTRLFPSSWYCWAVWAVHILSAIVTAFLTPRSEADPGYTAQAGSLSLSAALRAAVQTMALICGWVVLFRVMLAFCQRWFLWVLPQWTQLLFSGVLELANGSCSLALLAQVEARFILFAVFLGFGGLCVAMQTGSVCDGLGIAWYLRGKVIQAAVSFLLSAAFISREMRPVCAAILLSVCFAPALRRKKSQNGLAFFKKQVYNKENRNRGNCHAISQKDRAPLRLLRTQHAAE